MLSSIYVSEDGGDFVASLTVGDKVVEGFGGSFSEALRDLADTYAEEVDE